MSDEMSNDSIDGVNPTDPIDTVDPVNPIEPVENSTSTAINNKTDSSTDSSSETSKRATIKKPTKKSGLKIDKMQLIFFSVLMVGLIIFIIIMIYNNSKQKYTAKFGENITATIKINDEVFELEINADGTKVSQVGKCTQVDDTNKYKIEFEDKSTAECEIFEDDNRLILYYQKAKIEFLQ